MTPQSKNRLNRKYRATSSAHFDCSIFEIEIERCFAACVMRIAPAMTESEIEFVAASSRDSQGRWPRQPPADGAASH
jgi:hypothetical protein